MKKFYALLLSFCLSTLSSYSQTTCDSIVVRVASQADSHVINWSINSIEIDSFLNGKLRSYESLLNFQFGNTQYWYHQGAQKYFYDSLTRLSEYYYLNSWNGQAYTGGNKFSYQYDSLSKISVEEKFYSSNSVWGYATNDARIETVHNSFGKDSITTGFNWNGSTLILNDKLTRFYNQTGKDSLAFLYKWNVSAFDTINRYVFYYDADDSLNKIEIETPDTSGWKTNTLVLVSFSPTMNGITEKDSIFHISPGSFYLTGMNYTNYDTLGNRLSGCPFNPFSSGNCTTNSYICGGTVYPFEGGGNTIHTGHGFLFDSLCRPITESWVTGMWSENLWSVHYYYLDCNSVSAFFPNAYDICSGDTVRFQTLIFGGTPPYHLQWSPSNTMLNDTVAGVTVYPLSTQLYTLTVTDSNGVSGQGSIEVNVDSFFTPHITMGAVDTISDCNKVTLIGDLGNYSYSRWYYNGQLISSMSGSSSQVIVNRNGIYVLGVYSAGSCFGYDTLDINFLLHSAPDISIVQDCNKLIAVTNSGVSFSWTPAGGTNDTITPTSDASYKVYTIDSLGCSNYSSAFNFKLYRLNLTSRYTCTDSCNGYLYSAVYGNTEPTTYNWSTGDTSEYGVDSVCLGSYSLTVTDARGCVLSSSVTVTNYTPPPLTVTASAVPDSFTCNAVAFTTLSIYNDPSYTYNWSNGITGYVDSNLCAGNNSVTLIIGSFCTETVSFNVPVNASVPPCEVAASVTNSLCSGQCNGSINLNAVAGSPPYTYEWIAPVNIQNTHTSYVYLCPGVAECIVIDGAGCIDTVSAMVNDPGPVITTFDVLSINQNDPCSTLVHVNFFNAAPYHYVIWCNQTQDTIAYLCPGYCGVEIINGDTGCRSYNSLYVPDSSFACYTFSAAQNATAYLACDGSINLNLNGTPPYNIQWTTGDTSATMSNLCAGTYYFTVTDSVGCSFTDSVVVEQPLPVGVEATDKGLNVLLSPNPASDFAFVFIRNNSQKNNFNFEFFDDIGRSVFTSTVTNDFIKIDLRKFSKGIYTCKFSCNNGLFCIRKLVVQ